MSEGVARLKKAGISVVGATVTCALGSTSAAHGFAEQGQKRKQLNDFIRSSKIFDGVIDFDAVILDPATGQMKPEFVPESTTGGPGDTSSSRCRRTASSRATSSSGWRRSSTS